MYKETKQAISRYHAVLGVRERNVKLATLSAGTLGVQVSTAGQSTGIYLNKAYFNKGKKAVEASTKKGYSSGWHTQTNKPLAHTVTHELAHATWNTSLTGANHKAEATTKAVHGKADRYTKKVKTICKKYKL